MKYKALSGAIRSCGSYPDPECTVLREKIGQRENIQPEHIICGNGAADLIFRTVFAAKSKKALLLAPTFSEYEKALSAAGCEINFYALKEENDFALGDDLTLCFCAAPIIPREGSCRNNVYWKLSHGAKDLGYCP